MVQKTLNYLFVFLSIYALISTTGWLITDANNDTLRHENHILNEMNSIITNYANSTSDTGEFDEFIQSKAGQHYFELNEQLVNN